MGQKTKFLSHKIHSLFSCYFSDLELLKLIAIGHHVNDNVILFRIDYFRNIFFQKAQSFFREMPLKDRALYG